jgi:16S rRNA (adenine1518-N6/adenine1519-N6)-dimethyltransferase
VKWNRTVVAALLRERGLRLSRSLGQNFLVDSNFLDAIVRDGEIVPGDAVVEIGSGLGNLTERLAAAGARVWAFEIDERIHELSRELVGGLPNVTLIRADGADFVRHVDGNGPLKIVSNLPYRDWQRILLATLSGPMEIVSHTLMVQTDLYERLKSAPGTKGYGPMAALLQGTCEIRRLRRAGRELFFPTPRVDSTLFRLVRRERGLDYPAVEARLRALFAHRRKQHPAAAGRRIESLSPSEILSLCGPTREA